MFMQLCCTCDTVDVDEEGFQQYNPDGSKTCYEAVENSEGLDSSTKVTAADGTDKARLQDLVKEFAKAAVHGVECRMLDGKTGASMPARYTIDGDLQRLTVSPINPEDQKMVRDMSLIQDVHDFDAMRPQLPKAVLAALAEGPTRECFLAVTTFGDGLPPVLLLEANYVDRERFVMCMKILRIYAQSNSQKDTATF